MKNLCSLLFFGSIISCLHAQPVIEWQRALGGSNNEGSYFDINISESQQTSDNGYILTGYTDSSDGDVSGYQGAKDVWVVKLNNLGAIAWQKTYGGSGTDAAVSICQTNDGGYIMGGITSSTDGDVSQSDGANGDFWLVKINELGAIQWEKTVGGSGGESIESIVQTNDGGYIAVGTTSSVDGDVLGFDNYLNTWVVKFSETGEIQWSKVLGGSEQDNGVEVKQTSDGGYILASFTTSNNLWVSGNHGWMDFWLVKLDATGALVWAKTYGGSFDDFVAAVQETSDGGFIVAGSTNSNDGDVTDFIGGIADFWVFKINSVGDLVWQKTLGGLGTEAATTIQQTVDGGFIVGGYVESNSGVPGSHGKVDYLIFKIDSLGGFQWQKVLGGSQNDYAGDIIQTNDGGYLVSGVSQSNDGDVSGNHGLGTANGTYDYWVVKLSPENVGTAEISANQTGLLEIFPNPATTNTNLKISLEESSLAVTISDIQGRQISQPIIPNGGNLDVSKLDNGVYTIVATTPSGKLYSNKLSIQK